MANGSHIQGTGPQVLFGGGDRRVRPGQFTVALAAGRGIIIYLLMLLVSLTAAVGMLFISAGRQVLAIIMALCMACFGLVSLLPNPVHAISWGRPTGEA